MSSSVRKDATDALSAAVQGDKLAAERLGALVYDRLRAVAGRMMRHERAGHTLDPTALVHEAWLRLVQIDRVDWRGKTHFLAVAAHAMRRVLIDHARRHAADKRGGRPRRVTLDDDARAVGPRWVELVELPRALEKMGRRSRRRARVAEMKLYAGLESSEIAQALGVSERTVKDDWRLARAWLARELGSDAPGLR